MALVGLCLMMYRHRRRGVGTRVGGVLRRVGLEVPGRGEGEARGGGEGVGVLRHLRLPSVNSPVEDDKYVNHLN